MEITIQQAITAHKEGKLEEAKEFYRSLLETDPTNLEVNNNLGVLLNTLGRFDEAEIYYRKAIAFKPDFAEVHFNLGNMLKKLKRFDEAEISFNNAIKFKPDYVDAHNKLGSMMMKLHKFYEAEVSYKNLIQLEPSFTEGYNNLGIVLINLQRFSEAEIIFNKVIELKPDHIAAHNNLGILLEKRDKFNEAEIKYRKAIELNSNFAEGHFNLGNILYTMNRPNEAEKFYRKAIVLKPDHPDAYINLALLLESLAKFDEAEINFKKAIELKPDSTEAYYNLNKANKKDNQDEYLQQMHKLSLDKNLTDEQRCYIFFSLADIYKNLNRYKISFEYYSKANAIHKNFSPYDINKDIKLFEKLKQVHPKIQKNKIRTNVELNKLKITFIIGMPRSGTTLIEQIISSHSDVMGAGEMNYVKKFGADIATEKEKINQETLLDFRNKYLIEIHKKSNGNLMITDKTTFNFKYIGLIFSAFPEAKIVHVYRNSAATCWGNFQKLFRSKDVNYSYDLDDITAYYKLYKNLMQYWDKEYGDRIYNLNYEALTINQEEESRKLIQYLELKWENECLAPQDNKRSVSTASVWQVRQKIYKDSSKQWTKFEPFLKGAFDHIVDLM
tara:strand:- start:1639 stop:3474 length:1836 start_codon:yes stop_codon:yes gene_type:complete